jgi:CheY-like chemotaxis protein
MCARDIATKPKEFAEAILREHRAQRIIGRGSCRWEDDPEAGLVALAAMATHWDLTPAEFEAKLERLRNTPTGVARPAAERMLALWREWCGSGVGTALPTVLVVEDDESIRRLICYVLDEHYRVVAAASAREALEVARRERPAAITLDLMLPDAHGVRVLTELKADPITADIPVLIISAYTGGVPSKHRGLATAVLRKPFAPLDLLEALRSCVRSVAQRVS